jgi:hypothetical protein
MKFIISKYFALGALLTLTLTPYVYADAPNLPKSTKVDKSEKSDKIEIVPEIKIEAGASSKNSKLKEGEACNFDDLEEAKGPEFSEIPMAKTMPCADVDCKELKPARLHKDNYTKLNDAKTIAGCD